MREMQAYSTYPSSTVFQRNRPIYIPTHQTPQDRNVVFSLPLHLHQHWLLSCFLLIKLISLAYLEFIMGFGVRCKFHSIFPMWWIIARVTYCTSGSFCRCFVPELWQNPVEQIHTDCLPSPLLCFLGLFAHPCEHITLF